MDLILVEGNRIGDLYRHSPDLYFNSRGPKRLHEFAIKLGNRSGRKGKGLHRAITHFEHELMPYEVQQDFERFRPVWNPRSGQASRVNVERDIPPMIHKRGQTQAHFANDL